MGRLRRRLQRLKRRTREVPVASATAIRPDHAQLNRRLFGGAQGQPSHGEASQDLVSFLVSDARDRSNPREEWLRGFEFATGVIQLKLQLPIPTGLPAAARDVAALLLTTMILTHLH